MVDPNAAAGITPVPGDPSLQAPDVLEPFWVPGSPIIGRYPPGSRSATAPGTAVEAVKAELSAYGARTARLVEFRGVAQHVPARNGLVEILGEREQFRIDTEEV